MTGLKIRPATEDDVPVILALIRGLAEYERARSEDVPVDEATLRGSLFGPKPQAEVLIAWHGTEAAGFAVFFHNYSTWRGCHGLYLEDLFVRPEMRGRGYGRALLETLARIALERGCVRMEWMVLDWNHPAINFYRRMGAEPLNEWTRFRLTGPALAHLARAPSRSQQAD